MAKETNISMDTQRTMPAGLKWLAEMEALNSPALLNVLYGNIYAFPHVKDAEILLDRHSKKMLVYIKFSWLTRKLLKSRKKEAIISLLDNLQELLPSFEFRIIEDKNLFNIALKRMQDSVRGGKNEEKSKIASSPNDAVATGSTSNPDDREVSKSNPVESSIEDRSQSQSVGPDSIKSSLPEN